MGLEPNGSATPQRPLHRDPGPYLSGKTTLLEAILARTGAVTRQGTISDKNTVGDARRKRASTA